MTPAWLSIVTFRRTSEGHDELAAERINAELIERLIDEDVGFISSTRLRGRYVMRVCVLNPSTRLEHVEGMLERLASDLVRPSDVAAEPGRVDGERDADVRVGWVVSGSIDERAIDAIPVFASLEPELRETVLAAAYERRLEPGEAAVERWETSREFFVVLEGTMEVVVDGAARDRIGPGEFFGELAALDWGAEYGYPRLATVAAMEPARLLVLPGSVLDDLVHRSPDVAGAINEAIRSRLPGL